MRRTTSLRTRCICAMGVAVFRFFLPPHHWPLLFEPGTMASSFCCIECLSVEVSRQSSGFLPLLVDVTFFWLLLIRYVHSLCSFVCVCMTACASSPHLSARARQFVLLFAFVIFFLSSWLSTLRPFFFFFLFYTACRVSVCGSYKENNSARRHREITKMRGERKKKKRLKEKNLTNRDEFKPQLLDGCTDHR